MTRLFRLVVEAVGPGTLFHAPKAKFVLDCKNLLRAILH